MGDDMNQINKCEVCGNDALVSVLDLGKHPMCDDLVAIGDSRICREYPIEILFCRRCRTAHQRFQVPKQDLFPSSYHYRSRFTSDVLNGMKALVESCGEIFDGLIGKTVVDVGCNDGSLLDFFRQQGAKTIGVEPTGASDDAEAKGHTVYHAFLCEQVASAIAEEHGKPDFITFTNVFAHIEDLGAVLRSLKVLMDEKTVIVIENHYLGAVLSGNQFDTFYHEHPRTYSFTSFVHIARALGVELLHVEFPSRYGGNIRVFLGHSSQMMVDSQMNCDQIGDRESRFGEEFALLRANIGRWRANKNAEIARLVTQYGPLRAKAFPGRAAILVKLLGLDHSQVAVVYEKPGSMKIGHYLPGSRIPICSDDTLFASTDFKTPILNLAWHISTEIKEYLSAHGFVGEVVDILSVDDFI